MPLRKKKKIFECDQRPVVAGSYALHQFMEDEDKKSPEWKPNDIDVWFPNRYDPGNLATAYAKHILNLSNGEVKLYVTSRASRLSAEQCGTDEYKRMKSELVSGEYPPGCTATDAVDGRFTKNNSETVKMDVGDMFELIYCIENPSYEEECNYYNEGGPMSDFFENNGLNLGIMKDCGCEKTTDLHLGYDFKKGGRRKPTFGKVSFIGTVPNERHYAITPNDVITRFDLSVCQVAMTVDINGKRTFFFGDEQVKDDILQRQGRVMFVDNIRLINRVEKYEKRGFNFLKQSSTWYTLWNAWSSAQETAAKVEQFYFCLSDDFQKMKLSTRISLKAALSAEGFLDGTGPKKRWYKERKEQLERYRNDDLKLGIDCIQKHCVERSKSMVQIIHKQREHIYEYFNKK